MRSLRGKNQVHIICAEASGRLTIPPSFRSIYHSTPLKSPTITAYALKWTPNTLYGDLKEHAGSVKAVLNTPEAKKK